MSQARDLVVELLRLPDQRGLQGFARFVVVLEFHQGGGLLERELWVLFQRVLRRGVGPHGQPGAHRLRGGAAAEPVGDLFGAEPEH